MTPFRILRPATLPAARDMLAAEADAKILAGGSDLLGEMKEGVVRPATLVDIGGVSGIGGIQTSARGATIGALATLASVERHADISQRWTALAQAAASVATPQIRNVGTLGGNLCQRPRCWYYRNPLFDCFKKGGDACPAIGGMNKYHAILGAESGGCCIVHPSDVAVALVALDAEFETFGARGARRMPAERFFASPAQNPLAETTLGAGEMFARAHLPPPADGARSVYIKAKERRAYDFALASVAARIDVEDGAIVDARFALGGVAPTPYPLPAVSEAVIGSETASVDARALGRLAVQDARPLSHNAYKVRLSANLVARAIETLI